MLIKRLTNYISTPIYGVLLGLVLYSFMLGSYMQALSFIGAIVAVSYAHNQLNSFYDYVGGKL